MHTPAESSPTPTATKAPEAQALCQSRPDARPPPCAQPDTRKKSGALTAYCPATKRATTSRVMTPWVTPAHASPTCSTAG